jgi:hypothetical protein
VTELDSKLNVKEKYTNIHVSGLTPQQNRFSCEEPTGDKDCDGYYIFYQDGWATVGPELTITDGMLVASGNFSGCMYKIYHVGGDAYRCAHIARPAGANSNTYVTGMDEYAKAKKWKEVLAVPTAGLIGGRCSEVFVASQYFHNSRIDSVILQVDKQGLIVEYDVKSVSIP